MIAVRTARLSRSFSRVPWKWVTFPLRNLKARVKPKVRKPHIPKPRLRGVRRKVRSKDPDPHIDGRA